MVRRILKSPLASWLVLLACLFLGGPAVAQAPEPPTPAEQGPVVRLGLRQAIDLALGHNLLARLAEERRNEARGLAEVSQAELLPQLMLVAGQDNLTSNLAAGPFSVISLPGGLHLALVGPYNVFDARLRLVQNLFDLAALDRAGAGRSRERLAEVQARLSREQVAALASLAYVNAWEGTRALEATRADLELAQALLSLARAQFEAGVAAGVDVTRAESQLAQARLRTAQAEALERNRRLELLRATGLSLDSSLELVDDAGDVAPAPARPLEELLPTAKASRTDLAAARERVEAAQLEHRAAEAEHLPSLQLEADYGLSGSNPDRSALPTRSVGVVLTLPVYQGGRLSGAAEASASRERQARMQLEDLELQVEQDVRRACDAIRTSEAARDAAEAGLALAERELAMSRHRFEAGVADSVELTTAQNNLERARLALVAALAQVARARISLAAASGTTGGLDTRLAMPPSPSVPGGSAP